MWTWWGLIREILLKEDGELATTLTVRYLIIVLSIQRPLMLHGHERAITQIKYNKEGDLLFSVAKDHKPTVWFSANGERLGTYNGHGGAVWCVDVNRILY